MRHKLFFLFVISVFASYGQVPGFMGKRFILFADANPTPAFFVQNSNNTLDAIFGDMEVRTDKVNRFAFNFRPQVTGEYLIGRDIGLGISYSQIMIGTTRAYQTTPASPYNLSGNYEIDLDVIRGQAAGIHLKFYHFSESESIAPIGFYHTFSAYITRTNTYDNKKSKTKLFRNDFVYPAATYSWGRQSMIAKGLLLKIGVEMGWAFTPTNYFQETQEEWSVQEYSGYNVHRSLAGYYFFNVNLGLGYALF
jgi:hypothetical protein